MQTSGEEMNPKWLKLAGDLLELAADEFSNHGCNDWEWPDSWSAIERREFAKSVWANCGTPEYYDPKHLHLPDMVVMSFLADQLKKMACESK